MPALKLRAPLDHTRAHRRPAARVADALRLTFFRRVPIERMAASWLEIAIAILLTIAVPTAVGYASLGDQGRWDLSLFPAALFDAWACFLGAIAVTAILRRTDAMPRVFFAALLVCVTIDIGMSLPWLVAERAGIEVPAKAGAWIYFIALAWIALAVARFALPLVPPSPRRVAAMLAALGFISLPIAIFQTQSSLWVFDDAKAREAGAASWRDQLAAGSEDAIYAQPEVIQRELESIEHGRPGVIDVFYVGMAGYGRQDVFMHEVDAVEKLMEERFDAGGRTVQLVNNPKTVMELPIANVTTLRATLARVAEQMDGDEDILVLFLTSHGSATHELALDLPPLLFNTLDPHVLRSALDESGIRNRVVIVSACYSGGFIEPLRDDNTLVIAASAPDRNSFGCGNEEEWTYFGRAYFDEALRRTRSFTRAFDLAVPAIEQREAAEKFEPSKPMMSVGPGIAQRLASLERRLELTDPRTAQGPRAGPARLAIGSPRRSPEPPHTHGYPR